MSKRARSARGDIVDFDLIAIRQQLASAPAAVEVDARREYIDIKDGTKTTNPYIINVTGASEDEFSADAVDSIDEDIEIIPETPMPTAKTSKK